MTLKQAVKIEPDDKVRLSLSITTDTVLNDILFTKEMDFGGVRKVKEVHYFLDVNGSVQDVDILIQPFEKNLWYSFRMLMKD